MKTMPPQVTAAQDTFLNHQGMDSLRQLGREKDPAALREVARQFEALFLQQMLKSMRSAGDVFAEDNFMNSSESQFYRDMYDQQISLNLTQGQGIGLADVFYRKMLEAYGDAVKQPDDAIPTKADLGFNLPVSQPRRSVTAAAPTEPQQPDSPEAFINSIRPYANWAASVLKVDAKAIMAQAALETGWGRHVTRDDKGETSHNLFNIKATSNWQGEKVRIQTTEYEDQTPYSTEADFRRYPSLFSAFADYVQLLQHPRYEKALAAGTDTTAFAEQLQEAGYATDPRYAEKIQRIVNGEILNPDNTALNLASLTSKERP